MNRKIFHGLSVLTSIMNAWIIGIIGLVLLAAGIWVGITAATLITGVIIGVVIGIVGAVLVVVAYTTSKKT
jgi:hypothetical protein